MKRKIFHIRMFKIISIAAFLFIFTSPSFSTEVGEPLRISSHEYGFFSGDYYTWATVRGIGETIEIFVENAIWDSSIVDTSYDLPSNYLTALEPDGQGGLYIGTSSGLAHFDGTSFTNLSDGLSDDVIGLSYDVLSSVLWIATPKGLYKYTDGIFSLVFKDKGALPLTATKAENSIVWFGTALGLYKWNDLADTVIFYPSVDTLNSPVSDVINDIELDASGNPWFATNKGIGYLDTTWKVISSLHNLISDNVSDLTLTDDGIWVCTDKGLAFYVNDTTYSNYERKNSGLTTNTVRKVKVNDSVRWIATGDGMFSFQGDYTWKHFGMDHTNYLESHTTDTLNSLDIRDIAFINDGVYAATSWGLTCYKPSNGTWETWRGPYTDKTVYADSALVAAVLDVWDSKTPGLDSTHYFYNGVAQALDVIPGGDTLGIYDEITRLFGDISDVDRNGKVTVFLLDIRDYWDDAAGALDGLGDLTFDGFFDTRNLFSIEPTMRKDLLYIDARRQSQVEIEMALANTLTRHILYNNDPNEQIWLTEGLGMLAEIFTGYIDQNVGFKGFDNLNYSCKNSILSWQAGNPYLDKQFSEMLLLFMAEQYQSGNDGGIDIVLDIACNSSQQGIDAFNTALSNFSSEDTFSDIFFNLGVTAVIEQQKASTMPDHPRYGFSYHTIGSITDYNTIYWGKNKQDDPPYKGDLPQWSSRIFNGRRLWAEALEKFRYVNFNGADNNHFRVALLLNKGTKPDTSTIVIEIPLDENYEATVALLDTLDAGGFKTYSVFYVSDFGDGSGVTQMVMSQDIVSPDAFGGIKVGVAQNPLEEKLLDLYVASYEPLCKDVGDATFIDDGGDVLVISAIDTITIPMAKLLEDESSGDKLVPYTFTYDDSTYHDTLNVSTYYMYHAEYTIKADGNYTISVAGQDISGNGTTSNATNITVSSVGDLAKTIVHSSGEFSIDFAEGSVQGVHTIVVAPVAETDIAKNLSKSMSTLDIGFINPKSGYVSLSNIYKVGPGNLFLNKPITVRFAFDISSISTEDRQYVGVYRNVNGNWIYVPTRIRVDGFIEAETKHLGIFQLQKGIIAVEHSTLPREYALHQNYPNPFNPTTKIKFDLPEDAVVTVKVYNMLGNVVSVISKSRHFPAGYHSVSWDGTNTFGKSVSSGIYYYTVKAGQFTDTKKMVLVR